MRRLIWVAVIFAFAGCQARQLANDQDSMRQAVLDLHTNQIMDNLIRIRQGLPILHVDYLHMTGTISQTAGGTFGDSQSLIDNVTRTAAATFSHTLTNGQTYGASANQF